LLKPACSDPVRALLIFLNLLERETEGLAEFFLTHRQHHSPHSKPGPHVPVDRVRGLLCHSSFSYAAVGCRGSTMPIIAGINNHATYLFNLRSNADFASPRLRPGQGRRKATWASPPACRAVQSERRHPRLAGPFLLSSELAEPFTTIAG